MMHQIKVGVCHRMPHGNQYGPDRDCVNECLDHAFTITQRPRDPDTKKYAVRVRYKGNRGMTLNTTNHQKTAHAGNNSTKPCHMLDPNKRVSIHQSHKQARNSLPTPHIHQRFSMIDTGMPHNMSHGSNGGCQIVGVTG